MNKEELRTVGGAPPQNSLVTTPSANITATGNGIAIGQLNDGMHIHIDGLSQEMATALSQLFNPGLLQPTVSHAIEWASLRTDAFCLFVLENEKYDHGVFSISKRVALAKYTPCEYKEHYRILTTTAVEELIQMPCIFAVRNKQFRRTTVEHPALLGKLTDVSVQAENLRFCFIGFTPISQQFINEHIHEFGLRSTSLRNQLDEEHWSIRKGNLPGIITQMGFAIN